MHSLYFVAFYSENLLILSILLSIRLTRTLPDLLPTLTEAETHLSCDFRMAEMWQVLLLLIACIACFPGAHAWGAGDTIALIGGLFIGIVGIFACLGCYARKKRGDY